MVGEGLKIAAQLAVLGLDPIKFLKTRDSLERSLMLELGKRISEEKDRQDNNLAVRIAEQVGKLFSK